jgi:hypothetical protein
LDHEPVASSLVLEEPIGRGSLGVVWRGRDATGRAVAAKQIPVYGDGELLSLLAADGGRLAALEMREPAAAAIVGWTVMVDGPCAVLVMDLISGGSWADRLSRADGRNGDEVATVGATLAGSLASLHSQGLLHGDLKGSAVLFDPRDSGNGVRLADAGLATRFAEPARFGPLVHGTVGRLDPAVVAGDPFGAPSDVFALGVLCAEMLLGELPWSRPGSRIPSDPGQSLLAGVARLGGTIPPSLVAAIGAALDRRPAARPTAAELAATLVGAEGGRWRRSLDLQLAPAVRKRSGQERWEGETPAPSGGEPPVAAGGEARLGSSEGGPPPALQPGPLPLRRQRGSSGPGVRRRGHRAVPRRRHARARPAGIWGAAAAIAIVLIGVVWRTAAGPQLSHLRQAEAHPALCPAPAGSSPDGGTPVGEADVNGHGCVSRVVQIGQMLEVRSTSGAPAVVFRFWPAVPDGQVVIGDFGCDGRETPALYDPSTGKVFVYLAWPGPGRPVSAVRSESTGVTGGRLVVGSGLGARCSTVRVLPPAGHKVGRPAALPQRESGGERSPPAASG